MSLFFIVIFIKVHLISLHTEEHKQWEGLFLKRIEVSLECIVLLKSKKLHELSVTL